MKVIGIARQQGEYEGRRYDNFLLYCSTDPSNGTTYIGGYCPNMKVKVKSNIMSDCVNLDQVANLVGHDVDFYYDSYKNVCKVLVKS